MKLFKGPIVSLVVALVALVHAADAGANSPTSIRSSVSVPLGTTGLTAAAMQPADPAIAERAHSWMRGMASGWMPNRGQIAGPDGRAATGVLYTYRTPGTQLHLTRRGISAFFIERSEEPSDPKRNVEQARPTEKWSALELELVGATIRAEQATVEHRIEELGEQHFYAPQCPQGILGVPSYERVTFREVYPGIDWVLIAGRSGPVHQDFIVHPGADPARIKIRYHGAKNLRLDSEARTLHLRTSLGEVSEGPLHCYQGDPTGTVPARFKLRQDVLTVQLGEYDRTRSLTIDPPLIWSTLYGGSDYDGPRSILCDNRNGDVYVVGYTASANLPCSTGVGPLPYFDNIRSGAQDAFIWKFTQLGQLRWATYYGGTGSETATDCAVDRLGNLYVVGFTASSDLPLLQLPGAYWQPTSGGGGMDGFLLRFNAQGVRQWATYYGGDGSDFVTGATTDSTDQLFVVGYGGSTNLNLVNAGGGAYWQPSVNGPSDSFLLRFNTLGAMIWGTYFGGDSGDNAFGLAVSSNSLYVVGETYSSVFPTLDPPGNGDYFQGGYGGNGDAFISRFTLGGVQTWSTFYGGTDFDQAWRPVITPAGHLYVDGLSNSADLPLFNPNPIATPNQPAYFQGALSGPFDLFMLRFTPGNARAWATYLGGNGNEDLGRAARSLTVDSRGRVYVTGVSGSTNFPCVNPGGGAYFQNTTTGSDAVYARFSIRDSLEWGTYFGGNGASFGTAVSIGLGDCLFGTGEFQNGNGFNTPPVNPPGLGAWFRVNNSGSDDGFITKFCENLSACCTDFTCTAVASAAECNAIGGTAFYANQTCAQTNCVIDCTICGKKYSDLNRNGVQDNGEPALPGWTIELRYPNGAFYNSMVTGANGEYCFNNIPCGPWLVTEAVQNGWVKVAPSGPGHALTLGTGTTQNGVDFGNYACPTAPSCNPMPPGLVALWPFDDGPGATQALDVTHTALARNTAQLFGGALGGAGELCLASPAAYAVVSAPEQTGLDFGSGSMGLSVWLKPDASSANGRVIVEKRGASSLGGLIGWSLRMDGMQCVLALATGSALQEVPGPVLTPGVWSHVAVSVDRANGEGRWYLNGSPLSTGPFTPAAGSLDNTANLFIGQQDPALGTGPGFQGCIAQVAIFRIPMSPEVAAKAAGSGPGIGVPQPWCPDYAVIPTSRTICSTQNSVQVCFNIGNNSAAPVTYSWSLAGLPAGPGCTSAGPTQFSPSSGTVTVPAGGVSPAICVTVTRPAGFTQQAATACYALTFVNQTTGICRTRTSTLKVDNSCWCASVIPSGIVAVPVGGAGVSFTIRRPCDPITAIAYRVVGTLAGGGYADPQLLSIEGAAPGSPLTGTISAGDASEATLPVKVYFPAGYDPAAVYELVLEADTDNDGIHEPLASAFVAPAPEADGTTGVVHGEPPVKTELRTNPNPFIVSTSIAFRLAQAEPVSLAVYDFSGRLVRSLVRGWLEPGERRLTWDGRDNAGRRLAPGVYFARLQTRSGVQQARLVKMQ